MASPVRCLTLSQYHYLQYLVQYCFQLKWNYHFYQLHKCILSFHHVANFKRWCGMKVFPATILVAFTWRLLAYAFSHHMLIISLKFCFKSSVPLSFLKMKNDTLGVYDWRSIRNSDDESGNSARAVMEF